MRSFRNQHSGGFTFVELLVAIAVIGVLVSIGIVSIPSERFAVRQAAEGLASDVQLARFQAISRNTYVRVDILAGSNAYRLVERDSGEVIKFVDFDGDSRTARVAILSVDNDANDIVFDPRGIGIGLGPQSVVLGNASTGFSVTVSISQPGRAIVE